MPDNPVIFVYNYEVSIGGPPAHQISKAHEALNRAWGFSDGKCNTVDEKGDIVAKPGGDDPDLVNACREMHRHARLSIEVSLHRNGKKTYRLKP